MRHFWQKTEKERTTLEIYLDGRVISERIFEKYGVISTGSGYSTTAGFWKHINWRVRFQVLTAASMKVRIVFWDVLPCKIIVDRRFRDACCLYHQGWGSTIILHGSTSQKTILTFTLIDICVPLKQELQPTEILSDFRNRSCITKLISNTGS
jgi:hypothetical protein